MTQSQSVTQSVGQSEQSTSRAAREKQRRRKKEVSLGWIGRSWQPVPRSCVVCRVELVRVELGLSVLGLCCCLLCCCTCVCVRYTAGIYLSLGSEPLPGGMGERF